MADPQSFNNQVLGDPKALEQDAVAFANRAVTCDQNQLVENAVFYYKVFQAQTSFRDFFLKLYSREIV